MRYTRLNESGRFEPGLHDLGAGCHSWLSPDGSWGLSNAGLVADGGESLLVDTWFDYPRTAAMLDAEPAARHTGQYARQPRPYERQCAVEGATIVATAGALDRAWNVGASPPNVPELFAAMARFE